MLDSGCHTEMRHYQRVEACASARVSIDGQWHDCFILNISAGGASIASDAQPPVGDVVMLCEEELGFVAASVSRHTPVGFAVKFGVSEEAKQDLIAKLTAYLNTHFAPLV